MDLPYCGSIHCFDSLNILVFVHLGSIYLGFICCDFLLLLYVYTHFLNRITQVIQYTIQIRDGKNANFSLSLVIVILNLKNRYLSLFTY